MSWRSLKVSVAVALGMALALVTGAPASAHTVTWNEYSYTTPITDWADGVNMCAPVTTWFGEYKHTGGQYWAIDIGVPTGTPIYSTKAGWAWYEWNGDPGGGHMIKIRHTESGGSLTTVLAHLSAVYINGGGQWVDKNVVIGRSGGSGGVAPHLHWQMNVSDHMYDGRYGANLDLIPGVMGHWSPRRVCGVEH